MCPRCHLLANAFFFIHIRCPNVAYNVDKPVRDQTLSGFMAVVLNPTRRVTYRGKWGSLTEISLATSIDYTY